MAWTQTRNNIAERVLRICGVISVGDTPSSAQYSVVGNILQGVIEDLHNIGYRGSQIEYDKIDCVDGTASYSTDEGTLDIIMAYINDGTNDQPPLIPLTAEEYYGDIEDKTEEGLPLYFFTENKEDPDIYLYPTPDSSDYDLKFLKVKKATSMDAANSTIDLEKRWWNAVTYKTAQFACDEFSVNEEKARRIYNVAEDLIKKAKRLEFYRSKGNEVSPGYFGVDINH